MYRTVFYSTFSVWLKIFKSSCYLWMCSCPKVEGTQLWCLELKIKHSELTSQVNGGIIIVACGWPSWMSGLPLLQITNVALVAKLFKIETHFQLLAPTKRSLLVSWRAWQPLWMEAIARNLRKGFWCLRQRGTSVSNPKVGSFSATMSAAGLFR